MTSPRRNTRNNRNDAGQSVADVAGVAGTENTRNAVTCNVAPVAAVAGTPPQTFSERYKKALADLAKQQRRNRWKRPPKPITGIRIPAPKEKRP